LIPPPIEDYAFLGDCRTGALVSSSGSIDWMCLPIFDGLPVFGRLVDGKNGGWFSMTVDGTIIERRYRDDSAVLETTWGTAAGRARLTEGFVTNVVGDLLPDNLLVRRVEAFESSCAVRVNFNPRQGLPGSSPRTTVRNGALVCSWGVDAIALVASAPLTPGTETEIVVEPGVPLMVAMSHVHRGPLVVVSPERAWRLLEKTDDDWRGWAAEISYDGPRPEMVRRSLITLRMLTFSPSGAPVAAPTTSLPESVGGERNWDYRYSWPRDASIGMNGFIASGKPDEAGAFIRWLSHATKLSRPKLGVLYNVYGNPSPDEREAADATGYSDSRPVRIGNGASGQHQLDTYGWVLDASATFAKRIHPHDAATWRGLQSFADHIAAEWTKPDAGIWERRSEPTHHVHSKLMAWLGLDRTIRGAAQHRTRRNRLKRWMKARDDLAADIRDRGFDDKRGVYVQSYGSSELDASLLLLPVLEFDPVSRVLPTIRAIQAELSPRFPLVYRYLADDMKSKEGVFLPVCFWLAQALARTGQVDEARQAFDELCGMASPVGLFAEELDPATGAHLGNFPQAFTHAALVQAALALSEA
jgi:GH15 family glucan-1,4-alpha-glucosidase